MQHSMEAHHAADVDVEPGLGDALQVAGGDDPQRHEEAEANPHEPAVRLRTHKSTHNSTLLS